MLTCEALGEEHDGGGVEEGGGESGPEVFGAPAIPAEPSEGARDAPAAGQDDEADRNSAIEGAQADDLATVQLHHRPRRDSRLHHQRQSA